MTRTRRTTRTLTALTVALTTAIGLTLTALPAHADEPAPLTPTHIPTTYRAEPGETITIEYVFKIHRDQYISATYFTFFLPEHTTFADDWIMFDSFNEDGTRHTIAYYGKTCTVYPGRTIISCSGNTVSVPWPPFLAGPIWADNYLKIAITLRINDDAPRGAALAGGELDARYTASALTGNPGGGIVTLADGLPPTIFIPADVPTIDPTVATVTGLSIALTAAGIWFIRRRKTTKPTCP